MYESEMQSFFCFCSDGVARILSRYKSMLASRKEQEVCKDLILLLGVCCKFGFLSYWVPKQQY